jgi:biotin carboxyl carrier protein
MIYDVVIDGTTHRVELTKRENTWLCKVDDTMMELDAAFTARDVMSILLGGKAYEIKRERALSGETHMIVGSDRYASEVQDPRSLKTRRAKAGTTEGPQKLTAPMPGKIVRILLPEKSEIEAGQGVIVIEAMKMQNELKSPKKGVVSKVLVAEGATVNAGDALVIIE